MTETQDAILEKPARRTDSFPATHDPLPLQRYTKIKLALAAQLHALRQAIERRGDKTRLQQCDDLMAKLAEDRFTLAVLGQFKRGKSSLMNAIIGRELLPVGVLPLTSAITILRYGPEERLLIRRENMQMPAPEEFPVRQLAGFVTEKGNPGNRQRVKSATLEIPLAFLRRGLEFVDTPGVGSAIEANTATTMKFLPECDAALFVTSVDSPFNRAELDFLAGLRRHVHKIFFVVNKTDLLAPTERQEVLDFVRYTLAREVGGADGHIFPVSSKLGLAAKQDDDWTDHLQSGLSELEGALAKFLSDEKAAVFLDAILRRALWLLEQEAVEPGLQARARELPEAERLQRLNQLTARWEEHKHARQRDFEKLRQRIVSATEMVLTPELSSRLREVMDEFIVALDRRLAKESWWPVRAVWRETGEEATEQARQRIAAWLAERTETLGLTGDEAARSVWQRIQADVAGLPQMAADTFGLRHLAGTEMAPPAPWRLPVTLDAAFVFDAGCQLRLPSWLAWVPAGLARQWFKAHLRNHRAELEENWRAAVVQYVTENARQALDKLAAGVDVRAEELGLRMMASLKSAEASAAVPDAATQALDTLRRDLLALRRRLAPGDLPELPADDFPRTPTASAVLPEPASHVAEPPRPEPARDLKTRNCPVCEYRSRVLFHFLARFQYDLAQDEKTQEAFAATLGFCPLHTWQLASVMSPAGASAGLARTAEHVSKILAARAKAPDRERGPIRCTRNAAECRVCRLLDEQERDYLRRLAEFIQTPAGRNAYAAAQGLCLRHLGLWLPLLPDEPTARFILGVSARRFDQMSEDLRHFCLKTEALRRQWRNLDEEDAYQRAIVHLVGTRNQCQPMSAEAEI
jgi:GTP-binding protein EngB required for normal cell division